MDRRDRQVLLKVLKHINAILLYCSGCCNLSEFEKENMRIEACVFNMMQIGELVKIGLSDELKVQITDIPWNQLYGMRNRIVYGYAGVDMSVVWDTICLDLPKLKKQIAEYIKQE